MQRPFVFLLMLAFALAACGGNGDAPAEDVNVPDAQGEQDTTNPEATEEVLTGESDDAAEFEAFVDEVLSGDNEEGSVEFIAPTPASEGALPILPPGTFVASETEEAEPPGDFDRIVFEQEGGQNNTRSAAEIFGDGRVVRNGETFFISTDLVAEINRRINDLNFFGLQGLHLGTTGDEDTYTYRIAITSGDQARRINAQDGYMPLELAEFLGFIRSVVDIAVTGNEPALPDVAAPGG